MGDMVQVHLLTAYPAALLNRDDAGLAKRLPFGGAVRTRVSSQCLKKHWREAPLLTSLGPMAHRSKLIFERVLVEQLRARRPEVDAATAGAVAGYLMTLALSSSGEGSPADAAHPLQTKQVVILTQAETAFLGTLADGLVARLAATGVTVSKPDDVKKHAPLEDKELKKMLPKLTASLDTALFGRMVTSDLFNRVDAAVGVAHAFTTHAEEAETDYFTAVDTLKDADDDAGAGTIQDTELTSGVFYQYAVLDMEQLRANLVGCEHLADRLARHLVMAMATVSPGAKRGSTAPYAWAELVLLERGPAQPRTLANAFLKPVRADGDDLMRASVACLLNYRARLAAMHGVDDGEAVLATCHDVDGPQPTRRALPDALAQIFGAEPAHA